MSDSKRIIIVVLFMTLALAGMVAKKQYTLNAGELVVLKTEPIDPRSLFRGDYVRLRYDISTLAAADFPAVKGLRHNDTIYVSLQKGEAFWGPKAVSLTPPEHGADIVVIKGRVNMSWLRGLDASDSVNVKYGIENYFVPEGEGLKLERLRNQQKVSLQIAVDAFGNAGIKAVLVDGKPYYTETLF